MNIAELGLKSLETGEHTSILFEGQEITNKQMNRASNKLGNALKNLGVQRGDRVILQMPNCPEVLQSFQAILENRRCYRSHQLSGRSGRDQFHLSGRRSHNSHHVTRVFREGQDSKDKGASVGQRDYCRS
jgi:long-subunit acyl-CoA synthetase (AMP-forming)